MHPTPMRMGENGAFGSAAPTAKTVLLRRGTWRSAGAHSHASDADADGRKRGLYLWVGLADGDPMLLCRRT
jgi:hypothetical protein